MKTSTLKRRVVGGIVALSLVGITLPTPQAQAVTPAELQAQIQSLLAQITALQNLLSSGQTPSQSCSIFNRNLTIGHTGAEVTNLQNFLIDRGYNIPAGATGYFGGQTRQAVARFQADQGIGPAVGYFGPLTRGRIQNLCTPVVIPTPTPSPTPSEPLSGEASLERYSAKDGDDTDLEEGDNNAEVMEVSFRVEDGDVRLNRIDIGLRPDTANDEDDPWDVFEEVSIWNGTTRIAEVDASRESNWREDSPTNGDFLLRLSGLDDIVREGREIELTIKASIQNSVRGTSDGEIWTIFIPDNGIRGFDADNATVFTGDSADATTLNLDQAGASDELLVRRSDEDPDASVLQLNDNRNSGYLEVFAFDLDTDDSRNDIDIRRLPIELTVNNSTLNTFMRDIRLVVDGETYTDESTVNGSTGVVTFQFDRGEFTIDNGDRITVVVEVDFQELDEIYEGTTIVGHVTASDIEAEGDDDLTGNQLQGAATGEVHSLFTKGTSASDNSSSAVVTSVSGSNNDYATFDLNFNLTAFGQDAYIPFGTDGVSYQLQNAIGTALSASGTAVVTSSADERGNFFHVPEGSTEKFTLTVTYLPGVPNTVARLQLLGVHFNDSAASPDQTWNALPASNYRSPAVTIVN